MPHKYQVANPLPSGVEGVELPDGITYAAGQTVVLDDVTADAINPAMISNGLLVDLGELGPSGDAVTTQGNAVTLTSAQLSGALAVATTAPTNTTPYGYTTSAQAAAIITLVNDLLTAYNQLQADVANLNTQLSGPGRALT